MISFSSSSVHTYIWKVKLQHNIYQKQIHSTNSKFILIKNMFSTVSNLLSNSINTLNPSSQNANPMSLKAHTTSISSLKFSNTKLNDKSFLATAGDQKLCMFNVVNGKLEKMQRHMADVANLDVSACGNYVAVSTVGGCVFVYYLFHNLIILKFVL